ncbi:hypothetical protein Cgig2_027885 [Carnegiea gigantea]|uniref:DUF4283 domain-containing protein n=1 Tax=Carnegiea gigantea TaxID=171969 RepID=A0A9Q1KLL9_9CARY|nr:hypothetical protein Cgig2_027885 [Carnegiea gigantea]
MVWGLKDAWSQLKLTEEEEQVIVCEEDESEERLEQISLCLWEKLLTDNYFNGGAMKMVLKNVWKLVKGVVIWDLDKNLFSPHFFSEADKRYVLDEDPWAFDGHILLLREIAGMEETTDIEFDTARLWVGTFYAYDEVNLYCGLYKSINFQVDIDINKPLRCEVKIVVKGKAIWIDIGYVKLPDFCYWYGKVGHTLKGCDMVDGEVDESKLQYGE